MCCTKKKKMSASNEFFFHSNMRQVFTFWNAFIISSESSMSLNMPSNLLVNPVPHSRTMINSWTFVRISFSRTERKCWNSYENLVSIWVTSIFPHQLKHFSSRVTVWQGLSCRKLRKHLFHEWIERESTIDRESFLVLLRMLLCFQFVIWRRWL